MQRDQKNTECIPAIFPVIKQFIFITSKWKSTMP